MNFQVIKIENCFSDSQTYEYTLPITGSQLLPNLTDWQIRVNEKLRRPTAIASRGNTIIKCILSGNRFRVSFPDGRWQAEKNNFEQYLENLTCIE